MESSLKKSTRPDKFPLNRIKFTLSSFSPKNERKKSHALFNQFSKLLNFPNSKTLTLLTHRNNIEQQNNDWPLVLTNRYKQTTTKTRLWTLPWNGNKHGGTQASRSREPARRARAPRRADPSLRTKREGGRSCWQGQERAEGRRVTRYSYPGQGNRSLLENSERRWRGLFIFQGGAVAGLATWERLSLSLSLSLFARQSRWRGGRIKRTQRRGKFRAKREKERERERRERRTSESAAVSDPRREIQSLCAGSIDHYP